ncbi:hypothetical protein EC973_006529 [Apophysomyces ossiformis]|uniref:DNA polymerase n=1 Tax=Apophysomyces ossiformis TaxID=679940 RepID=A0A8H7BQP0_9FUNG|nr:hypothetical protein EC973_006529 [Apophysomyces ossiformis]
MLKGRKHKGGQVCSRQEDANLVLTNIKAPARASRYLKNRKEAHDRYTISHYSEAKRRKLPFDNDLIHMPKVPSARDQKEPGDAGTRKVHTQQPRDILNKRFEENEKLNQAPVTQLPELDENTSEDESRHVYLLAGLDRCSDFAIDTSLAAGFINTRYECLRPTPLVSSYNQHLVSLLQLLEKQRELNLEDKSALSYSHAVAAIKVIFDDRFAYPKKIQSVSEASKIIGIGKKISGLIDTYLKTGHIPEAEDLLTDPKFLTLRLFNRVFGVGPSTAKIWWDIGYRTLQEVLDKAQLSAAVRLGIELLPDLIQPMNRKDVEELVDIIRREVVGLDEQGFVTPVGGYRRGKEENGDLDIIISSTKSTEGLLRRLVDSLVQKEYIRHKLWFSDANSKTMGHHIAERAAGPSARKRVMDGLDKPSKGILRQVDLIVAGPNEYITAVLGWTGSRQFERSLRDYAAKEKNMSVSSEKMTLDTIPRQRIIPKSEEEAFEKLGMPWLEPEMRNC